MPAGDQPEPEPRDEPGSEPRVPQSRRATPEHVARELRQRAGFGCCRCGLPVYQYHHIIPWHVEEHFRVEDMMVLCPTCHDAATKGALNEATQRKAQADPHNLRQGYASGALLIGQDYPAIASGGTLMVGDGAFIRIDGRDLLRLDIGQDGELQLSIELQDRAGTVLAIIERSEWLSGEPGLWDIRSDHDRFKLWSAPRRIAVEIDARANPVRVRADLWQNGQAVMLNSAGISFAGSAMDGGGISGLGLVGFSLSIDTAHPSTGVTLVAREGGAVVVSEVDPIERLRQSVNTWRQLETGRGHAAFLPSRPGSSAPPTTPAHTHPLPRETDHPHGR